LFLLPYVLLPWAGQNGWFDAGVGKTIADALFPASTWSAHGREYWRSVGLILAWPLMFWNVFTHEPIWAWLMIGFLQTFVVIPLLVRRWGKGGYCGWICSCGALAETMGDAHRHKMPHGPRWNRVNLIGQVFLAIAFVLLVLRIVSWTTPGQGWTDSAYALLLSGRRADGSEIGGIMRFLNYTWVDDLLFAGILGVCFYFWFSGRVWCRFACPLAALMHIYARFSRFRILADKKKCISCNVCTSVCHQGIDIMNFANKGLPMEDPECVRCSACVQMCPTGVLTFGQVNRRTGDVIRTDPAWLRASPVQTAEGNPPGST
jgi:polyferredoxin